MNLIKYRRWIVSLLSSLVITLLLASGAMAQVPSPEEVYGFQVGADYKLAGYDMLLDYYNQLDAASDRVKKIKIGESTLGRPMILLLISSKENLKQLDHWREISRQLARAHISEDKAQALSQEGKAIVWIDGGMHASETAHAQMTSELAYRVATEKTPEMQDIRENVVLLLMPVMNPDGLEIVKSWYESVLGTPYETTGTPWLWQKYVGHDNNRDYYMYNMKETQAVGNVLYREWYPQVVYNHHQTGPSWAWIFIPPFADPYNPRIHPGVIASVNQVGTAMATRFAMRKMPGVISRNSYTMWWNGGGRTAPYYHNMIGILTETSHRTPTPLFYEPDSMPKTVGDGFQTNGTEIFYSDPWKGGESHLRDAVEYMLTASMAVLDWAADRPQELLFNIYRMGRDAIEAGMAGDPYAYVIPAEQWDEFEALNLVETLRQGGVEVSRSEEAFSAGGNQYANGSYIIYAAQAFRPYVLSLLEPQDYPLTYKYPGGPPDPPYDIAGWTLPMQMGVTVDRIDEDFNVDAEEVTGVSLKPTSGYVAESVGYGWVLSHRSNASIMAVNHLLAEGVNVYRTSSSINADGEEYTAGAFVIEGSGDASDQLELLASTLGLDFVGLKSKPVGELTPLSQPRVGLYKSWNASSDEGWTAWILKDYHFAVDTLHDAAIREVDLSQYDAIILPDQRPSTILNGYAPGTMPDKYVGGLGAEGAVALKNYVDQGGTLLAFDSASEFVINQFGLPIRNAVRRTSNSEFFIPGSLIRANTNAAAPLAVGMQDEITVFFDHGRAFEIIAIDGMYEGGRVVGVKEAQPLPIDTVVTYATKDLLMSGFAIGAQEHLAGEPAMLNVSVGEGNVVLYGFRPQFRGQSRGTYKLIFNAIYSSVISD